MDTELERIEVEALKLSVEERERLIEVLIDSLDQDGHPAPGEYGGFASAEIQKSWLDEAQRRIRLKPQRAPTLENFSPAEESPLPVQSREHFSPRARVLPGPVFAEQGSRRSR